MLVLLGQQMFWLVENLVLVQATVFFRLCQFHNPEFASIVTDEPNLLSTKSTISIFWVLIDTYLNISNAPFFQAGQMQKPTFVFELPVDILSSRCVVEAKMNKTRRRLNSYHINSFYIITYILWAILSQGCFKR